MSFDVFEEPSKNKRDYRGVRHLACYKGECYHCERRVYFLYHGLCKTCKSLEKQGLLG